ncbi:hypothetical protein V8E55_007381 [Tylopilus felleus]
MSSTGTAVQLGPTYGVELLATFVAVALWGTTCMQTELSVESIPRRWLIRTRYPKDRLILKSLVVWLWLVNTVHEILIVKGVYDSQIVGFCDYHRVQTPIPEYLWQALLTTFFTHRIWRFNGTPWFYWAILVPVCLFELVGVLVFIAFGTILPAELVSRTPATLFVGIVSAIQAVSAAADLAIAAGLIILLIKRKEHALKSTRSLLQRLLVLTINTGIWTALFAVFCFVAMIASEGTLIYAAIYFPLCPLYCNTVLANLNARDFLRERSVVTEDDGVY